MWGTSWQNLQMMLIDMPYFDHGKETDKVIEINSPDDIPEHLRKFKKK